MTIERIELTDRASWLELRGANIGASEMPIVVGEAAFGSLAELYAEKKGLRPPRADTAPMRRGRYGEAAVFEALGEERPEWVILRSKIYLVDRALRIGCTPDGFAMTPEHEGRGIVQAKTIARGSYRRRFLDDPHGPLDGPATPPRDYLIQTNVEMQLAECKWALLAVLIVGEFDWQLRLFELEPDPVIWDRCLFKTEEFFREYFDRNIMPDFMPQRDEQLVRALYPRDLGTTIDLSGDNRAIAAVEELTETQAALGRLRKQESALKTELTGKLGDATFGLLPDGRVLSWKLQHRRAHHVEASDFRVLRILKSKPEEEDEE